MKIMEPEDTKNFIQLVKSYDLEDLIKFSKTVKVLYIDKDTPVRHDYYGVFKIFFHDIDIASDGQEGLEYFHKNRYDLIILSLDIKKLNGVELIQKIRTISRHITILVLSSKEKYFIELIRLGIDGYILSPVEVKQFVEIIQKVIETLQNKQALYEYRIELEKKNEELFSLNQNLQQKIKDEVDKNRQKDLKLFEQAKITSMADMLSNIAHQWRQPLSIISTAASGIEIQKKFNYLTDDILYDSINKINIATKYLSDLIDIFRRFVKDDDKNKKVLLQDWIITILGIVYEPFSQKNITIVNKIEKKAPLELKLKVGKLSAVIINILKNAEEILILRKIKDPTVTLDMEILENNLLLLTIEDNGGGIEKNILPKIFEPYFTTKHQSQGTGLGLYLSYRTVIDNLGGNLYAANTKSGAKFTIELPINNI